MWVLMEGQLGVLAVGPALLGCWGSGFPLGALGDHVGGCLQHPLPSAPVTARGELPPHKLLTGHCDGKQDGGSCHGSSVLSPLPHCRQEPESPLKMSKSPFLTLSVLGCRFLVAVVEVMLGTGLAQARSVPTFGHAGSKWQLRAKPEQPQTLPPACLASGTSGFAGFGLFLNQPMLNCLNSPRAPTKAA